MKIWQLEQVTAYTQEIGRSDLVSYLWLWLRGSWLTKGLKYTSLDH